MLYDARFRGFNAHPRLEGTHAVLSPSSPQWLRYPREKLIERLGSLGAAARGTKYHSVAALNIEMKMKLLECDECPIIVPYVNDCIDFGMKPEQMLFYSLNCYGTADAISFDDREMFLRIHDLKTGVTKASVDQLYVYAGIFCNEYGYTPFQIHGEFRIYQGLQVTSYEMDRLYLAFVYDMIRTSDEIVEEYRQGGLL